MLDLGNLEPLSKDELEHVRELDKQGQPLPPDLAGRIAARNAADYAVRRALGGGSPCMPCAGNLPGGRR